MKRLLTLALSILFFTVSFANPVSETTAQQVALNWFSYKSNGTKTSVEIQKESPYIYKGQTTMYIYEFKNGGFVIVAADDASIPILGYSVTNTIHNKSVNESFNNWLLSYALRIQKITEKKSDNSETTELWNKILKSEFLKSVKAVDPLVQTTWNQDDPYWFYCPGSGSTKAYVGCVATAAVQVMKYNEWPPQGYYRHTYEDSPYGVLSADFKNTSYNWNDMPNSGDNANHDVARISYQVGIAVDMDYDNAGSGAYTSDLTYVFANYFGYDQNIKYAEKENYSDIDWFNLLKSEIDASQPMVYSGYGTGGHAFVCDGYDDNDKFHFNWGWGGSADGYYAIGSLNPSSSDFNDNNGVVYNIKPAQTPEFKVVRKYSSLDKVSTNNYSYILNMSAVNDYAAWGVAGDGSGSSANYRSYTKTVDGGLTWQSKSVTNLGGTAFSMIEAKSDKVAYIAMWGSSQPENKVIKTTDGGDTWTIIKDGGDHGASFFNVVHFFNDNDGFIQGDPDSEFEIWITQNGGTNWTRVNGADIPDPLADEYGTVGHYTAVGDTIWFGTNKGRVFRSTNKGNTWDVEVLNPVDGNPSIAFSNASDGVAILHYTTATDTLTECYTTANGGDSWSLASPTGNFYYSDIAAVPGTNNTFYSVGSGFSVTTDGGNTWTELADYYQNYNFTSLGISSASKSYIGSFCHSGKGGVFVYGDKEPLIPYTVSDLSMACVNSDVVFTSQSVGDILSYNWNFGDGATPATATGIGPHTVQYSTPGYKSVNLSVSDGITTMDNTFQKIVMVSSAAPDEITKINGATTVPYNSVQPFYVDYQENVDFQWSTSSALVILQNNDSSKVDVKFPFSQGTYSLQVKGVNGCGETSVFSRDVIVSTELVGVDKITDLFLVSPNPANDFITIQSSDIFKQVDIFTITGEKIMSQQVDAKDAEISLNKLSKGTYFIKISNNKGSEIKKLIIN